MVFGLYLRRLRAEFGGVMCGGCSIFSLPAPLAVVVATNFAGDTSRSNRIAKTSGFSHLTSRSSD